MPQPCHIGMLIRDPPKELLSGESGEMKSGGGVFVIDSVPEAGTVIAPLEDALQGWMKKYKASEAGVIYRSVMHIKSPLDGMGSGKNMSEKKGSEVSQHLGIGSDKVWDFLRYSVKAKFAVEYSDIFELVLERWVGVTNRKVKPDLSTLYCAELIAHVHQLAGVLEKEPSANTYLPIDFLPGRKAEKNLLSVAENKEVAFRFGKPLNVRVHKKKPGKKA